MNKLAGVALAIGAVVIGGTGISGVAGAAKGGSYLQYIYYQQNPNSKPAFSVTIRGRNSPVDKVQARLMKPGHHDVIARGHKRSGDYRAHSWVFHNGFSDAVRSDLNGGNCTGPPDFEHCVATVAARAFRGKNTVDKATCKLKLEVSYDGFDAYYSAVCGYGRNQADVAEGDPTLN